MKKVLEQYIANKLQKYVGNERSSLQTTKVADKEMEAFARKKKLMETRNMELVKSIAKIQIHSKHEVNDIKIVKYTLHLKHLVKQEDTFYMEEHIEEREAQIWKENVIADKEVNSLNSKLKNEFFAIDSSQMEDFRTSFQYDRLEAVKYAEKWWNSYNPSYKKFDVDCTNFISQCLYAGRIPMLGYPNRSKGWWMKNNNWSYSWAVSHSLRWYLSGANVGLKAKVVDEPKKLLRGDVIFYDFEGDGRFDHTTIVVAKDKNDMPLVNAHTSNSRLRYWNYEDSTAYTPNIKYKFFHILDGD